MQGRYVPDVGDFGKLGLIAALATGDANSEALSVGLVWYLTEPELDRAGNSSPIVTGATSATCDSPSRRLDGTVTAPALSGTVR